MKDKLRDIRTSRVKPILIKPKKSEIIKRLKIKVVNLCSYRNK